MAAGKQLRFSKEWFPHWLQLCRVSFRTHCAMASRRRRRRGGRGVSVTGSAKVAPLERYSWHGLHLPIVGGIFISFAFAYPATTCAASIIMINKFSLPIFDFNLQSPLSPLSLFPSTADCLLVLRDRFDRQPQCYGKISKLIKKPFLLYFFLLSLLLFLLQWLFVLRRH